jgi:hypothetical protein
VDSTSVPPEGFDERHFALAAAHGVSRERIIFVRSLDGMRSEAKRLDVPEAERAGYGENTWGLRIQRDDLPKGPDVFIVLKGALTPEIHAGTHGRLVGRELDPSVRFRATGEPEFLYAFLLLHEIAHHCLGHGGPEDAGRDIEDEADRWAYAELLRNWRTFDRPPDANRNAN